MRQRLIEVFDEFVDVSDMSDAEAARTIAEREVDILVDLNGSTDWSRAGVVASRPAPICVHYLGYPGPLGTRAIDYFVADSVVLPRAEDALYECAVVRLPHCYQVNDSVRRESPGTLSREAAGLPREGFVFCGFGQPIKLSAPVFDVWMRILARVPDSVLWLLEENRYVGKNWRAEARRRGIDPARLVLAPRVDHEAHLARQQLADLMLDTWPCGAHTTASDALRVGVPLITRPGNSFASRVGASLLHALDLPELVVASLEDYEQLAVELARSPRRLEEIKRRILANQATSPLFDTNLFRRHIEAAYQEMWQRLISGRAPESFDVQA